jgi:hypothetical protein
MDKLHTCTECQGDTITFTGEGQNAEYKICSRAAEPGHLSETEAQEALNAFIIDKIHKKA